MSPRRTRHVPWPDEPDAAQVARAALERAGAATRTRHDLFVRLDARGRVELRLVDLERFVDDALDLVLDDGRRLDLWVRLGEEPDELPELRVGPARRIEHDPPIGIGWRWVAEADPIGPSARLLLQRVRQALGRSDEPPAEAPPPLPGGWTYACVVTAGSEAADCVTPIAHALRRLRWWAVQRRAGAGRARSRTAS